MNAARLSSHFHEVYFSILKDGSDLELASVMLTLYDVSNRANGRKSLQFSFATKLLHVLNPKLPIYSSEVAAFFFYQPQRAAARIDDYLSFYDFLVKEYRRIIELKLLKHAIEEFRFHLQPPEQFSDEKIIDSLIWATVGFLKEGALTTRQIVYR